MRILCLEHADGEGPGRIVEWAAERGHCLKRIRIDLEDVLPEPSVVDFFIIMGGPMNIYQHRNHPWLIAEKRLIRAALDARKPMLGVCLGAQLLADSLGGKVFQNQEIEIGWHPTDRVGEEHAMENIFPKTFTPLHWHGDTFSLPPEARLFASSAACEHQAFIVRENIVGLQFHIEVGPGEVADFTASLHSERGRWVQSKEHILNHVPGGSEMKDALWLLLDHLSGVPQ